ncbi:hypothetical protein C8J57DRAFT_1308135 [Mycena rebaudengoi]|nr:hypothetical protein C8J57DRAFT_1308135 [Mycena rebaudengoi]
MSLPRTRTKSSMSSCSHPRPWSPSSLYVAYETAAPKAPKPLIKLEKKDKGKSSKMQAKPDAPKPSAPIASSFFRLRRKTISVAGASSVAGNEIAGRAHAPLPCAADRHNRDTTNSVDGGPDLMSHGAARSVRRLEKSLPPPPVFPSQHMTSEGGCFSGVGLVIMGEGDSFDDSSIESDSTVSCMPMVSTSSVAGSESDENGPLTPVADVSLQHIWDTRLDEQQGRKESKSILDDYSAAQDNVIETQQSQAHLRQDSVVRVEQEEGWMGEWNLGSMQDVIDKLRSLR